MWYIQVLNYVYLRHIYFKLVLKYYEILLWECSYLFHFRKSVPSPKQLWKVNPMEYLCELVIQTHKNLFVE